MQDNHDQKAPRSAHAAETDGHEVLLGGERVAYRLRRSTRRRTIGLVISAEEGLVVRCPRRCSMARVETVLHEKGRWILRKLRQMAQARATRPEWPIAPGAPLPLLGSELPLRVEAGRGSGTGMAPRDGALVLTLSPTLYRRLDPARLRGHVLEGYRALAADIIAARVAHFAALLGKTPRSLNIRAQRRRWGSCSARGDLQFNWRLVLAPPLVLDYVVAHELSHMRELNHSPRFWAWVARLMPGYAEHKAWLARHGAGLFALNETPHPRDAAAPTEAARALAPQREAPPQPVTPHMGMDNSFAAGQQPHQQLTLALQGG